jgi:hypothetical protein
MSMWPVIEVAVSRSARLQWADQQSERCSDWQSVRLSGGWWLVLVCSERKVLLDGCWWLVCCERKVLLAGGWQAKRMGCEVVLFVFLASKSQTTKSIKRRENWFDGNGTRRHFGRSLATAACSVGWWLMTDAGLFWEKSTAGWLLVAGSF